MSIPFDIKESPPHDRHPMTYQEILKYYGSIPATCEALNVTRGAVWTWKDGIPWETQCRVQVESDGALLAKRDDCPKPAKPARTRKAKRNR